MHSTVGRKDRKREGERGREQGVVSSPPPYILLICNTVLCVYIKAGLLVFTVQVAVYVASVVYPVVLHQT